MKNYTLRLSIFLISLIALWFIASYTNLTFLWFLVINLIALYIIYKYKAFNKFDIITGLVFGALCIPSSFIMGVSVVLPYIASMMIFKNSKNKIELIEKNNLLITIALILVTGGVLGYINILLGISSNPVNVSLNFKWIFNGLRAGIFEEIFFRLFLFAICVYLINDSTLTVFQDIICYAVMVIPHVLIHFNTQSFNFMTVIVLSLLFGLPFSLMQRKSNLLSAIGSHTVVDIMRFCIFGI